MNIIILIIIGIMEKSKSSGEVESGFKQLLQESKRNKRMEYEHLRENLPPSKQKAVDEVLNILLGEEEKHREAWEIRVGEKVDGFMGGAILNIFFSLLEFYAFHLISYRLK